MRGAWRVVILAAAIAGAGAWGKGEKGDGDMSQWVHMGAGDKLEYKTMDGGDRIMDFSSAGYMGGGVKVPDVPVKQTVNPSEGDNTQAIQRAIDAVSKIPVTDGFRGAVLLGPGTFECGGMITISTSGVVLRGSGTKSTTIKMTGSPHRAIEVHGEGEIKQIGRATAITDRYVAAGTTMLTLASASDFKVGDSILVIRPCPHTWVVFMGMDKLERPGRNEHWVSSQIHTRRTIAAISGNRITLDVPLTDSMDSKYLSPPGGSVIKCESPGWIQQVGVESLCISAPPEHVEITSPHDAAISMEGIQDGWIRDINVINTIGPIGVQDQTRRITVARVDVQHSVNTVGAALAADFDAHGTQILFDRCSGKGDDLFYFITGAETTGPIVLLHCTFRGNGTIQPHQRWATGLLVDQCNVPEGGIELINRGNMGTGHGWTIGWSVAWNCSAKSLVVQKPPGSTNWAIGCRGKKEQKSEPGEKGPDLPDGIFDSSDKPVTPASLYLEQLKERLGDEAVKNVED